MDFLSDEQVSEAFKDLEKQSDRETGIIIGSILEDRVKELLQTVLRDDNKVRGELFGQLRPLSEHSARLKTIYMIGHMQKDIYDDLSTIASIRNRFAHYLSVDSFEKDPVKSMVNNLITLRKAEAFRRDLMKQKVIELPEMIFLVRYHISKNSNRGRFVFAARHCLSDLKWSLLGIQKRKSLNLPPSLPDILG